MLVSLTKLKEAISKADAGTRAPSESEHLASSVLAHARLRACAAVTVRASSPPPVGGAAGGAEEEAPLEAVLEALGDCLLQPSRE